MSQFPEIASNLSTANFRASVLTQLANGIEIANDAGNPLLVSGTVEVTNDVGNPLPVSGTVEVTNDVGNPLPVNGTVEVTNDVGNPLPVNGTVTAQPVSGSLTMSNSSVSTASALMLAASSATKTLTIQNTSANTLYVSTTNPATSANGIVIGAGIGYQFPYIPTNALYSLGSAAGTTYTLWYA